jgi:RND family efflux transporter MFP subunit
VIEVPLPGSMDAILETGIWARTNGYLQARYVDIGDRVIKGQLLADIDTPEVDQQLMQAIATMNQDKANVVKFEADLALARTTRQRYVVAGPGTVSQQQIDERTSAVTDAEKVVDAGRATVNADEANVRRLLELQSFQKVYAPFDGVITVRNVDPGSLITAGSTTGTTELFTLAQVDVLRIFVFVPQSYAPDIKVGQTADVSVRELPGRVFQGTVARTAGAIDPTSRTLLTEVHVPNPDGLLLSGSYATVRFKVQRPAPPLVVPQSALLIDANGVRVALVDADGTLHYRSIQIGRDFGNEVEVLSGVDASDVLATGLAANIADGSRVETAKPAETTPGAAKP